MTETQPKRSRKRSAFFVLLLLVSVVLALIALLIPILQSSFTQSPQAGQVATRDYRAAETITFASEVLTEQRRDAVTRAVSNVYTTPDTSIARHKLESLRSALAYITSVRDDNYATQQQKLDDLAALEEIHLNQETATTILGLTDSRWQAIQQEAIIVLEKVMSSTIRPEILETTRARVPVLVSLSLPEAQAAIVAELASAFVVPNSEFSESLTEAARQEAYEEVSPVNRSFVAGQTIVQQGDVLSESDIEALRQLGLIEPETSWQDPVSAVALMLLLATFVIFYLRAERQRFIEDARSMALLALLFLVFALTARLIIPNHIVLPYVFPLAAYSLTVAALFGAELALVTSLPLAILTAYGLPNTLDLTLYYIMGSLFGVLALGRAQRMSSFLWAGVAVAVSGSVVILVYRLPLPTTDWSGLATLTGAALFNGLASASLTILLQFFLAQFLGTTTPMQLMDLTRPDHPLLRQLLRDAPGTYQHSLQVANLAEQAAENIGADALLTRVGALYHDVGKTLNPVFFIENQVPGFINPHTRLDPIESSSIIIRHVTDGFDLARKFRMPRRIVDFIGEHHGTMVTRYQYINAVKANGNDENQVDIEQFRYPGPRPQSRETAILMLADGSEARIRAEKPQSEQEMREMIKGVIDVRVSSGQLDDTNLTLRDLSIISESFTATLRGIYHPRVKYPKLESNEEKPLLDIGEAISVDELPEEVVVGALPAAPEDTP